MKLQLTITVDYDLSEMPADEQAQAPAILRDKLNLAVEHLADNGLLSGDSYATVSECDHVVNDGDKLARLEMFARNVSVWLIAPDTSDATLKHFCQQATAALA